ncbi:hypothetical protein [Streptomyces sp. NPDC058457]|uniref:hypothetical protein n=1 Tax=Streptomyces sp. NPDC058457 TaxID=3346507 RepID=UPI003659EB7A
MSSEPIMEKIMEPVVPQVDPIDLLISFEKAAAPMPIRAEYLEETGIVPPQPDAEHSDVVAQLFLQLNSAGLPLAGFALGRPLRLPAPYPTLDTAPFLDD